MCVIIGVKQGCREAVSAAADVVATGSASGWTGGGGGWLEGEEVGGTSGGGCWVRQPTQRQEVSGCLLIKTRGCDCSGLAVVSLWQEKTNLSMQYWPSQPPRECSP